MIKADYKNSSELKEYAKLRMLASIQRNDPQAALYWFKQMEWAREVEERGIISNLEDQDVRIVLLGMEADARKEIAINTFEADVVMYQKLKHLNVMRKNQGKKPFKLNLEWLRLVGKQYERSGEQ